MDKTSNARVASALRSDLFEMEFYPTMEKYGIDPVLVWPLLRSSRPLVEANTINCDDKEITRF